MRDDADKVGSSDPLGYLGWHEDALVSGQLSDSRYGAACSG
jgi:hypothetical protein